MINFKVPKVNLRNVNLFYSSLASNKLVTNAPINRLCSLVNMYNIDPFVNSFFEFKNNVNLALSCEL